MEPIVSLAALALIQTPGQPARLPLNPALALQAPFAVEAGEGSRRDDGWQRLQRRQSWFGRANLATLYLISPEGKLQSITISAPDCEALGRGIEQDLGQPDDQGASPQFLNSLSYRRWLREGVAFVLEDYAPGCELGIHRQAASGP